MLVLLLAACGGEEPEEIPPVDLFCDVGLGDDALSTAIEAYIAGSNTEGVVVGIADDNGYRVEAFGVLTPGGSDPMPPEAVFDIGSIQKSFRWMLLHRLVAKGELDIDSAVDVPTPDLQGATYRQLAMHTTGLKHWDESTFMEDPVTWTTLDTSYDYDTMISHLGDEPLISGFQPDTDMHYSNFGPLIAGRAIELDRDSDIMDIISEEIIEPMELVNNTFQDGNTPDRLVPGYWDDAASTPHTWIGDDDDVFSLSSGAGWLHFSDACDLLKYSDGIHDPTFLNSDDVRAQTVDVQVLDEVGNLVTIGEAGAGLFTYPLLFEGRVGLWGHLGDGQHGHSSIFMYDIETGTSYAVLANVAGDDVSSNLVDPTTGQTGDWTGDHYETQLAIVNLMVD